MTIDFNLAPLLSKYAFIFEFNGLKFKLPDDFDEIVNSGKSVKIKLVSLP